MLEAVNLECVRGQRRLFHGLSFCAGCRADAVGARAQRQRQDQPAAPAVRPAAGRRPAIVRWKGEDVRALARESLHADLFTSGTPPRSRTTCRRARTWLRARAIRRSGSRPRRGGLRRCDEFGLAGRETAAGAGAVAGAEAACRAGPAGLGRSATALWILDEPFTALDAPGGGSWCSRIWRGICSRGGVVVFTSHQEVDFGALPVHAACSSLDERR